MKKLDYEKIWILKYNIVTKIQESIDKYIKEIEEENNCKIIIDYRNIKDDITIVNNKTIYK